MKGTCYLGLIVLIVPLTLGLSDELHSVFAHTFRAFWGRTGLMRLTFLRDPQDKGALGSSTCLPGIAPSACFRPFLELLAHKQLTWASARPDTAALTRDPVDQQHRAALFAYPRQGPHDLRSHFFMSTSSASLSSLQMNCKCFSGPWQKIAQTVTEND